MNREPYADAVSMLVLWWRYEKGWIPVQGYPTTCPSTSDWKASRQYDTENGAMDTDERGFLAERIGHIVTAMPEPYRTALYFIARNRATGVSVWRSPRLPEDDDERAQVVADALEMFVGQI